MENDIIEYEPKELVMIEDDATEDIKEVRQSYKNLIEKGNDALDLAYDLLKESEHPRSVEVFSGLLTSIAQVNTKLLDLHKTKKELKEIKEGNQGAKTVTNNNVIVGSPVDLLRMINQEYD